MKRTYLIGTEADNKGRWWRSVRERLFSVVALMVCILPFLALIYWNSGRSSAVHECRLVVGNSTLKHDCNTNAGEIADLIGGSAYSFIQHIKDSHGTELDQERKRAIADTTLLQTEIDRAVDPSSLMGFQAGASQQSRRIEEGLLCLLMQNTSVDPRIRPQFADACSNPLLKFNDAIKYIESEVSGTHR